MARMPGAHWKPVVNVHKNGCRERRGLILHVQDGLHSPHDYFNTPATQASSDFWVSNNGTIEQYCNTGVDYAWAQAAGNPFYASVETEGHPDTPLTHDQHESLAHIYAWGVDTFLWPLSITDTTTGHGFGWHGAGGVAWGNHPGCPGKLRRNQRNSILNRARQIIGITPELPAISFPNIIDAAHHDPTAPQGHAQHPHDVLPVERALCDNNMLNSAWIDGSFGTKTIAAYAAWQRFCGYRGNDADGIPGPATLTALSHNHFTIDW